MRSSVPMSDGSPEIEHDIELAGSGGIGVEFNPTCTCKYSASLVSILIIPFGIALACVLLALYGSCGPGRRRLESRLGRFKNFQENLEAVKNPICEL